MAQEAYGILFKKILQAGVRHFVVSPGARNGVFIYYLEKLQKHYPQLLSIYPAFDERSGSFFALGLSRQVRVGSVLFTCTSGTAVTECYSAVVESFYERVSWILLSFDRPQLAVKNGAPQTIPQNNIFTRFASRSLNLDLTVQGLNVLRPERLRTVEYAGVVHLNICAKDPTAFTKKDLEESFNAASFQSLLVQSTKHIVPKEALLVDFPNSSLKKNKKLERAPMHSRVRRPLFVVGGIYNQKLREVVGSLFRKFCFQFPHQSILPLVWEGYGEPPFKEDQYLLWDSVGLFSYLKDLKMFDAIIKCGAPTSGRFWKWIDSEKKIPVYFLSHACALSGSGLSSRRGKAISIEDLKFLLFHTSKKPLFLSDGVGKTHKSFPQSIKNKFPITGTASEKAESLWVKAICKSLDWGDYIFAGNSLPIRHIWNQEQKLLFKKYIGHQRGTNGIDGQLSLALGEIAAFKTASWDEQGVPTCAIILGDLTFLYDQNGISFFEHCGFRERLVLIFVLNNGGGRIFDRFPLSSKTLRQRTHVSFQKIGEVWGLPTCNIQTPRDLYLKVQELKRSMRKIPIKKTAIGLKNKYLFICDTSSQFSE